jgi:hypothetical protein
MKQRIGFLPWDGQKNSGTDSGTDSGKSFAQLSAANRETAARFITSLFDTAGDRERMDFKTSAEIRYLLSETLNVSVPAVNEVMNERGFRLRNIEGAPCWEVYGKDALFGEQEKTLAFCQ